ncbi:hypothetical protein C4577_07205 [Candidatus Parcubacteria bacterium]|nr:MAG: hypothetical protein C4577_07205 [Candidatus Parcubacteria bacterium]
MGIESGPSGYIERPRTAEARIEGEVETSFTEIDMDQATHVPLRDIAWPDARLTVKQVGTYNMPERFGLSSHVQLYTAELEYKGKNGKKRKSNLSLTTSKKPVLFTGTTNGFYAHDPLIGGRENPFYVVGLQVDELAENMSRMSATWHELGHVALFHTDADTQLLRATISLRAQDLPPVAQANAYGNELTHALPYGLREQKSPVVISRQTLFQLRGRSHHTERAISLFHERNAWAAGIHLARANEYPTGFQNPESYFEYARLCLTTYERYYNERKFVKGWK